MPKLQFYFDINNFIKDMHIQVSVLEKMHAFMNTAIKIIDFYT